MILRLWRKSYQKKIKNKSFSISTILIFPSVITLICACFLVGYFAYQNGDDEVEKVVYQLLDKSSQQINYQLNDFLATPHKFLEINSLALETNIVDINDFDQLKSFFGSQFQLKQFDNLTTIIYANEKGEVVTFAHDRFGIFGKENKDILAESFQDNLSLYYLDENGIVTEEFKTIPDYDHRQLLWYQDSISKNKQTWLKIRPYSIVEAATLRAVKPIYQQDKLQGILTAEVLLDDICNFLRNLQFSPSTEIFIIDRKGNLIATTTEDKVTVWLNPQKEELTFISAHKSKNVVISSLTTKLIEKYNDLNDINNTEKINLTINQDKNDNYLAQVNVYQDEYGIDWLIVTAVNKSDFTAILKENWYNTILICLIVLFFSMLIILYQSKIISEPLAKLTKTTEKIAAGDLQQSISFHPIKEIQVLGRSFLQMSNQLELLFSDLRDRAEKDFLTGLYNRYYFEKQLSLLIEKDKNKNNRSRQSNLILFLDLDKFKIVNDTCGHPAGDEVLFHLANLIKQQLPPSSLIARVGGDEFSIVIYQTDLSLTVEVAKKIIDHVQAYSFVWQQQIFKVGVSIGIIEIPNEDNIDKTWIMSNLDRACYAAKQAGGNRYWVHRDTDTQLQQMRLERQWIVQINQAIENDYFVLYHQKIEPSNSNNLSHSSPRCEVLLRMILPNQRIVSPAIFVPIAERYSLMNTIDLLVIKKLFLFLSQNSHNPKVKETTYMVNLSGKTVGNQEFLHSLFDLFEQYQVSYSHICFEITETFTVGNLNQAQEFILQLKNKGCQFALDDFGSGMSSFTYMKELPVDYIKIDGQFVKNILTDSLCYKIVESISEMAKILQIKTIAEYVENREIREMISQMDIDYVQGYHVSKVQLLS